MTRKSFTVEITICLALVVLVVVAWLGWASVFYENLSARAAMDFIQHHMSLGESPEFILGTAGRGLPQPPEIALTWREFQLSIVIGILLITGLMGLAIRFWQLQSAINNQPS